MAHAISLRQSTISSQIKQPDPADRLGQIGQLPGPMVRVMGRIGLAILLTGISCWDAVKR